MSKQIVIKKWKFGRGYRYLMECLICHKHFEIIGGYFSQGRGKYCSSKCFGLSQIGHPAPKSAFKKGRIAWNKGQKYPELSGKNSGSWKGGKHQDKNGYWWIRKQNHPRTQYNSYVKRCWLVAEKYLGRPVKKSEVIHHINDKPEDDRPKNLYLFSSISKHKKYHGNQYLKNKPLPLKSNLLK